MARHYRNKYGSNMPARLAALFIVAGALLFVLCRLYPQSFPPEVASVADAISGKTKALITEAVLIFERDAPTDMAKKPRSDREISDKPFSGEKAISQDKALTLFAEQPKPQETDDRPMLAVVIDDGGESLTMARQAVALEVPLTWAILPSRNYTKKTAAIADITGTPYLLHLPMQAEIDKDKKEYLVGEGMTQEEIRYVTARCLDELPRAIGINNHRGSLATSKADVITPVIDELKSRSLIFFDSRTSAKSVAFDTAVAAGVKTFKNGGFLDNTADKDAIAARFAEAVKQAEHSGRIAVICHFRPATMLFLKQLDKEYRSLPVRLVTLPEMLESNVREEKEGSSNDRLGE